MEQTLPRGSRVAECLLSGNPDVHLCPLRIAAMPLEHPTHPTLPPSARQRLLAQLKSSAASEPWGESLNLDQMFVLIDGILPFEACLYYQVLPLFVEGNQLNLGMVSLQDGIAFEYVRRIISYLNYALVPRPLTSEAHQSVLTTYLNHASQKPRRTPNPYRPAIRSRRVRGAQGDRPTFLLNDSAPDIGDLPTEDLSVENPQALATPALITPLPTLDIVTPYRDRSFDTLAHLAPDDLLQALLARVLDGGIGRLYFECASQHGRILWSQDGVLQSVLEDLALPALQGVIDALKQMAQFPVQPIQKAEQVEVEYLYQRGRVLLRFQFMLGNYGETATVQILRGAALKFYQQQQINRLERDAMGIAKQLQVKLNEIRDRAHAEPGLSGARFDVLPNLNLLLQNMEQELKELVDP
jgi:type II secretory ATPase GspE/PulE/Tfp pilus assembly ATPase PilB-like protein